jgi:hypothetical protein
MVAFQDGSRTRKEEVVDEKSNRARAEGAFREWQDGPNFLEPPPNLASKSGSHGGT